MSRQEIESAKKDSLQRALRNIENKYGKGSVIKFGEKNLADVPVVPTGCLSIDLALGVGGLPKGRIVEIYGHEACGKTTLALHVVAEAQKLGGIAGYIDAEHAMDPVYAKNLGVNIDELYISQPDSGEQALGICEEMVTSAAIDVVVVDSVAALVPKAEIDGAIGDSHVGLQARLMSQALRKLVGVISKTNCIVIFINQLREQIGGMPSYGGPKTTTTGGRALKFYASVRIEMYRIKNLETEKDKVKQVFGSRTNAKISKNKVAPPFKVAEFDLMFGEGISREGDILDLAIKAGIAAQSGTWFSYGETRLGQGRETAKTFLKTHPDIYHEIENKVRVQNGLKPLEALTLPDNYVAPPGAAPVVSEELTDEDLAIDEILIDMESEDFDDDFYDEGRGGDDFASEMD
ncbi:MAG: recombinase RecA [Firmicutes bacterium]|nr:recombinase RecA [Bacillota bacterium]